ncbi:uncharacterized protein MELLADRAFT_104981 [Melampsora larici-populina 98AG31]|uniref:Uncharacterized protein n=1 Tax=Melampsora larici-populina (strain 98AG31 / pathotype 3-4-7) TaxID=747676 RepID=F4RG44_MELLP|nr:uncharacterized protein MELLADRAFT_104981 [Melampsora larici-populina 98AG31]EGG08608.1 hypothetical protein MELLADRAFT_104981 [Melampsora larici-populina 98AG31]
MTHSSQTDQTLNQDDYPDFYSDDFFYYEEVKMEPKLNSLRFTFHTSPSIWSQTRPITSTHLSSSTSSSSSSSSSSSGSNPSFSSVSTSSSITTYETHQTQTNPSSESESQAAPNPSNIYKPNQSLKVKPNPIGKTPINSNELHPDSWLYRLRNSSNSSNSLHHKSKEDQLIDSLLLLLADLASHH